MAIIYTYGPIGCRLKRARQASGLSKGQAAKLANLPTVGIEYVETGAQCNPSMITDLCAIYGVSTQWVMTGQTEMTIEAAQQCQRRLRACGASVADQVKVMQLLAMLPAATVEA